MILRNYGQVVSAHVDPIEKKPLYHFFPGRPILSVGTFGCNLSCRFCQNSEISQAEVAGQEMPPERLLQYARQVPRNLGVAFTYNEPGIWFEYVRDCAPVLRERGLKTVLVTNGYLDPAPWEALCECADAMNIDLKGFSEGFYQHQCGGALAPVLKNIETAVRRGVHVEVTNLLIPGKNTDTAEFERLTEWLAALSPDLPLHLSRYFPRHLETTPATEPELMLALAEIARRHLRYVFLGNVALAAGQDTVCPDCGAPWIERRGYQTQIVVRGASCACGTPIPVKGVDHE
jgi:pyruvate formate lyase activating enzyme